MTLGDGIFYSTALLVIAALLYFISINGKWMLVGKIAGGLVLAGLIYVGGFVAYDLYDNRPMPIVAVTEYMGIELGAPRVDVTLAIGEPDSALRKTRLLVYDDFTVSLTDEAPNRVSSVCTRNYANNNGLLGIAHNASEARLLDTLGPPSSESINSEGTSKILNFEALNANFRITAGRVNSICMDNSASSFFEEYSPNTEDGLQ